MDQTSRYQEPLDAFSKDELDKMLDRIKDYLREATKSNAVPQDQDHPVEDRAYTVSESDAQGLLYHILDVADQLRKKRRPQSTAMAVVEAGSSSPHQAPRSMCPVASATVDPATTMITMSEASFTPAVGAGDEGREREQTATTATVISGDSVTEITWFQPRYPAPAVYPDLEAAPRSPSSPVMMSNPADQPQDAESKLTVDHPVLPSPDKSTPVDSRYSVKVDYRPGSSIGNNTRRRRQSSTIIFMGGHEPVPDGGPHSGEELDQPTTVLGRIRKKSVQFSQAVGSFMNGAYRNADHKPRRESSEWCSGRTRDDSVLTACGKVLYA